MKVLIACAGSGGHINPGIAIANTIIKNEPDSKILFVGTESGMENDLVKKAGYDLVHIRAGRIHRKFTIENVKNIVNAFLGIYDSKKLIAKFNPDIVIGTGGYICVPVMEAAKRKKVPYCLHESNAYPGLSVKLAAKDAKKVFLGFEDTKNRLPQNVNAIYTGTPAKFDLEHMMSLDKEECKKELGLDKSTIGDKKVVFVTGGSQGAKRFNEVVISMLKKYKPNDLYFVIAVGSKNYDEAIKLVSEEDNSYLKIEKFIYDMDKMYKAADLLITRAGAMTITEISIVRRPAILVPLPTAAENHQYFNAKVLENINAGIVLEENVLNETVLYDKINNVIYDSKLLSDMGNNAIKIYKPNVEANIYNEIKSLLNR